jgi:hypothetical protein
MLPSPPLASTELMSKGKIKWAPEPDSSITAFV